MKADFVVTVAIVFATKVSSDHGACNTTSNFTSSFETDCAGSSCPSQSEILGDRLWCMVDLHEGKSLRRSQAFASPRELCESIGSLPGDDDEANTINDCMDRIRDASSHPVTCVVLDSSNEKTSNIFSLERYPTVKRIAKRLYLKRIVFIALIISIMTYFRVGTRQIKAKNILVLNVVVAVLCAYSDAPHWFSHMDMKNILKESFVAFREVHPVENTSVALAHFATYWIHASAWFAKTPRQVMIWLVLTEIVVGGVNEWVHHKEWKTEVRCTRVAFIDGMKQNGYDNYFREFWLGPFFVYFYLLPKVIGHWVRSMVVGA